MNLSADTGRPVLWLGHPEHQRIWQGRWSSCLCHPSIVPLRHASSGSHAGGHVSREVGERNTHVIQLEKRKENWHVLTFFCILFTFASRLFLDMRPQHLDKRRMLSLKHQQAAFENVYLKAQEGMRLPVSGNAAVKKYKKLIFCLSLFSIISSCVWLSTEKSLCRGEAGWVL